MAKPKPGAPETIAAFLAAQDPAARPLIDALRAAILAADPRIREEIKWNVPSFRIAEFFATLHLRVKVGAGVILHFGARKNAISKTGVAIADPQALLQWLGKDRATVTFRDAAELTKQRAAFIALLREWIQHLPA